MRIKVGDTVEVIAGKDKGQRGKVLECIPKEDRVIVEGINKITKHQKPAGPQNPGGRIETEAPIHVSNVMYFDTSSNQKSRIAYKIDENGKKSRVIKATGAVIADK
ncbi:MAG: 50S ribosomal protein L24 [Tissierellia bacterium]|nr:50S ribosomal protein L24 [Tissierellia bacterium]